MKFINNETKLFLAIDHGEYKTNALVFEENGIIDYFRCDRDLYADNDSRDNYNWLERIEKLINQLETETGIRRNNLIFTCIALNGVNSLSDIQIAYQRACKALEMRHIQIINDSFAALRSGWLYDFKNPFAACIYAGSGMNCCAHKKNGKYHSLGSRIAANDQGGYGIGRRIWNAVMDSYNGLGAKTKLTDLLLSKFNRISLASLIDDFFSGQKPFFPEKFAQLLFDAVKMNDPVACSILEDITLRWLQYLKIICEIVGADQSSDIDVFLSGGIFDCDQGLMEASLKSCSHTFLKLEIQKARFKPVLGVALLMLEKEYNGKLPDFVGKNINNSSFL